MYCMNDRKAKTRNSGLLPNHAIVLSIGKVIFLDKSKACSLNDATSHDITHIWHFIVTVGGDFAAIPCWAG